MKGFAFTLGMSTVLDLVVVFLFTHPLMAVLSRFKWFGSSRFSGLGQVEHSPAGRPASGRSTATRRRRHAAAPPAQTGAPMTGRDASPGTTGCRWAPTPTRRATPRHAAAEAAAATADDAGPRRRRPAAGGPAGRSEPVPGRPGLAGPPALQRRGRARRRRPQPADLQDHRRRRAAVPAAIVFRGFNFGIDFAGGNSFRLPGSEQQLEEVRAAAEDAGAEVATRAGRRRQHPPAAHRRAGQRHRARRRRRRSPTPPAWSRTQVSPESVSAEWGRTSPTRR